MPKGLIAVYGMDEALTALRTLKTGYGQNVRWIVGVGAEYGAYLEFGTSKMQAYPYLFPAARHATRTKLPQIEQQARGRPDAIGYIVKTLALEIEKQAKRNATAAGGGRSPGTKPGHPQRITGNLASSIEAAPAVKFSGGGRP